MNSLKNKIIINFIILNIKKIELNNDIYYYPDIIIDKGANMFICYGRSIKVDTDLAIKIHNYKGEDTPQEI